MPEQMTKEEAEEALHKAIVDHAMANGICDTDAEMLSDWAIIANWQPIEENGRHRYTHHFSGSGRLPYHTCIGLFQTGLDMVTNDFDEE